MGHGTGPACWIPWKHVLLLIFILENVLTSHNLGFYIQITIFEETVPCYMFFALGNILFPLCSSHLFLAVVLVALGFQILILCSCSMCRDSGGGGSGEEKQETYEIYVLRMHTENKK